MLGGTGCARGVDSPDQLIHDGARRKCRHERDRRTKAHPIAKHAWISEGQGDPRWVHELRVAHIRDVGQRDSVFEVPVPDEERIAGIQDFVDEIERKFLHHEVAGDHHDRRHDESFDGRTGDRSSEQGFSEWNSHEQSQKSEPNDRKDSFVEERHARGYALHLSGVLLTTIETRSTATETAPRSRARPGPPRGRATPVPWRPRAGRGRWRRRRRSRARTAARTGRCPWPGSPPWRSARR